MKRKMMAATVAATLMAGSSNTVLADTSKAYFGFGLGQSKIDLSGSEFDQSLIDAGVSSSSTSVDDTGNAWKAFVGYRFHRNFALEGGWMSLGEAEFDTVTTGPDRTVSGSAEAQGAFVDAVGLIPLNERFTLFGKIGVLFADVEASGAISDGSSVLRASGDETDVEAKFGLGMSFAFTDSLGMRAEYERINDIGDDDLTAGESDVDLWMISIYASF